MSKMLEAMIEALKSIGPPVYEGKAFKQPGQYFVYATYEGETNQVYADEAKEDAVYAGSIDYFTRVGRDPNIQKLHKALNEIGLSYSLNSRQEEKETGYIHYEWLFEIAEGE